MEKKCLKEITLDALKFLSGRNYSIDKLRQKLLRRGHLKELVEQSIQELIRQKYLRENDYIAGEIEKMMKKNFSPEYIQDKLKGEKILLSLEQIERHFQEHKVTSKEQIENIIHKKSKILTSFSEKDAHRLFRQILTKGHSIALAKESMAAYTSYLVEKGEGP